MMDMGMYGTYGKPDSYSNYVCTGQGNHHHHHHQPVSVGGHVASSTLPGAGPGSLFPAERRVALLVLLFGKLPGRRVCYLLRHTPPRILFPDGRRSPRGRYHDRDHLLGEWPELHEPGLRVLPLVLLLQPAAAREWISRLGGSASKLPCPTNRVQGRSSPPPSSSAFGEQSSSEFDGPGRALENGTRAAVASSVF